MLMKKKQVSVAFLLMWVGPKNMDEKRVSISFFLVNEGGSQKYGQKTSKYQLLSC